MRPRGVPEDVIPADIPVTFVFSEYTADVHVFVPERFDIHFVQAIAKNFSRRVQQPVKVFHDTHREKYRLCPIAAHLEVDTFAYGTFCFECDSSTPQPVPANANEDGSAVEQDSTALEHHIPRPKNSWILYRQAKSPEVIKETPGITAGDISRVVSKMWKEESDEVRQYYQHLAAEEDRRHKELYPDYKYTTSKTASKSKTV